MKPEKKKRAKPFNAGGRSRVLLESAGWTCWNVEQVIPHTFIKRDCFGFADILAMSPSRGIMLVQTTGGASSSNFNARIAKIKSESRAGIWLACGGRIQVHSWEGKGNDRQCRILEITREDESCS